MKVATKTCIVCKKEIGGPGMFLHMQRHKRQGDIPPVGLGKVQHPIDTLEYTIKEIKNRESKLVSEIANLDNLKQELFKLQRVRGNLEVMIEQYRGGNEEDKKEHQDYLASQSA